MLSPRRTLIHQDPIRHRIPEVVKSIGHAFHPPAELTNREVPLREGAEGGVELEGTVLGVAEELALERHPGLPRGAAVDPDEVLKIQGDLRDHLPGSSTSSAVAQPYVRSDRAE